MITLIPDFKCYFYVFSLLFLLTFLSTFLLSAAFTRESLFVSIFLWAIYNPFLSSRIPPVLPFLWVVWVMRPIGLWVWGFGERRKEGLLKKLEHLMTEVTVYQFMIFFIIKLPLLPPLLSCWLFLIFPFLLGVLGFYLLLVIILNTIWVSGVGKQFPT